MDNEFKERLTKKDDLQIEEPGSNRDIEIGFSFRSGKAEIKKVAVNGTEVSYNAIDPGMSRDPRAGASADVTFSRDEGAIDMTDDDKVR